MSVVLSATRLRRIQLETGGNVTRTCDANVYLTYSAKSRTHNRLLPTDAATITHISRLKAVLLSGNSCRESVIARQGSMMIIFRLRLPHHSIIGQTFLLVRNKPV